MLVLSRKEGEQIVIDTPTGERITVTLARLGREQVRIGVEAPRDWRIRRAELLPRQPDHGETEPPPVSEEYLRQHGITPEEVRVAAESESRTTTSLNDAGSQ